MKFLYKFLSHTLKIRELIIFILPLTYSVYADDSWMVYDDTTMATIQIEINSDDLDYMYNNVAVSYTHLTLPTKA